MERALGVGETMDEYNSEEEEFTLDDIHQPETRKGRWLCRWTLQAYHALCRDIMCARKYTAMEVTPYIIDCPAKLRRKKARLQRTGQAPLGYEWIVHDEARDEVQLVETSDLLSS